MEINQLGEMVVDAFELFMIDPTRVVFRPRETMFHIYNRMHQSFDVIMDLEIEAKGLCSMKCTEIYNQIKQWYDLFLKKI